MPERLDYGSDYRDALATDCPVSHHADRKTMKSPVFVFTQALSAGSYFPKWLDYYGRQVGRENLFVLTDEVGRVAFEGLGLGGVFAYPGLSFDDGARGRSIASLTAGLLEFYQSGIVVDTDEFFVPDPRLYNGILDFIERNSAHYVTAIGVDIIQEVTDDDLDLTRPILLSQRRLGSLNSSLCKTVFTRMPLRWGVGFHYCSVYPKFSGALLIHLKRADKTMLLEWQQVMSAKSIVAEMTAKYYIPDLKKIEEFLVSASAWPISEGWSGLQNDNFFAEFFSVINLDRGDLVYRGKHFGSRVRFVLPDEFRDLL